jgi:hypothetical protein
VYGVWGDDDALDEYLDRIDALEDENDPSASDLGGTRTGADETEPDTQEDAGAITMNSTAQDTAVSTSTLVVEYKGEDRHNPAVLDGRESRVTFSIRRTAENVIEYTTDGHVQVTADIAIQPVGRDDQHVHAFAVQAIRDGELEVGSIVDLAIAWEWYGVREHILPVPFDDSPEDAWCGLPGTTIDHMSAVNETTAGGATVATHIDLQTAYADWRHDPDAAPTSRVRIASPTGGALGFTPTVDELRALAAHFTAEADRLEAAQQQIADAKASTGVTA